MIDLHNIDCMEYMKGLDDNAFELAIVDPPYGIERFKKCSEKDLYQKGNTMSATFQKMEAVNNNPPSEKYFNELFRVSKNQIVWGGNYFPFLWGFAGRCFIYWDKAVQVDNFAKGELAWTSFDGVSGQYYYAWGGLSDGVLGRNKKIKNIHPTQKPIALYEWLLANYAKEGDKILDTHLGSGSSAIAAHCGGFDFVGCELDEDYFKAASERIDRETAQIDMF